MPDSPSGGTSSVKDAIVAAMPREVASLIQPWRSAHREFEGRTFEFFEKDDRVLVCGGIGPEAARRAAVAAIALYRPDRLISAGFAGALDPALHVGDLLCPKIVVNAGDGSRIQTTSGEGVLVSFTSVAGSSQKASLGRAFQAQAVDMEAAAVGTAAAAGGIAFDAVKAISDEVGFDMPLMDRYVDGAGQFQTAKFAIAAAMRPWLWKSLRRLASNSSIAAEMLCQHLARESL